MNRTTKIKITELNPHVICVLCGGYFINATTITECLHSFCRTCITRYLETSKYCPVCDVMVHKTRPLDYIRSDKTLQDLVYKLVPGLYRSEMKRRREYYAEVDPPGVSRAPSEDRGNEFHDRIIYTEDEKISLSLELCAKGVPFKTPTNVHGHTGPDNIRIKDVRYLQCPAAFSVGNLKKFIRMKFDLKQKYEMDIFHTAEPLPDYYSLMDIAYIYTWTRRTPLRLFYTVFERKLSPKAYQAIFGGQYITEQIRNTDHTVKQTSETAAQRHVHHNNMTSRKRKMPDGLGDVSPDLDLEKAEPYKPEKKKRGPKPKKKIKKLLDIEEDDSVKEAMSESEEQLAKLTLNCSDDGGRFIANGDTNVINGADAERQVPRNNAESGKTAETGSSEMVNEIESIRSDNGSGKENLTVETTEDANKIPSTQTSPGSVKLSLFQPLNAVNNESEDVENVGAGKSELKGQELIATKIERRGRPKGSKTKVKHKPKSEVKESVEVLEKDKPNSQSTGAKGKDSKSETPQKEQKNKGDKAGKHKLDTKATKGSSKLKKEDEKADNQKDNCVVERVKRKYARKKKNDTADEGNTTKRAKTLESIGAGSPETVEMPKCKDKESINDEMRRDTCSQTSEKVSTKLTDSSKCNSVDSSSLNADSTALNKDNATETVSETVDTENGNSVGTNALLEPVTPLYGETPNVNESNQGLPCSPNMLGVETQLKNNLNSNVDDKNCDLNGANSKVTSDDVDHTNAENTNGAKNENSQRSIIDKRQNEMFHNNLQTGYMGYERNFVHVNGIRGEIPGTHFPFRTNVTGTSLQSYLGAFQQPLLNAHAHVGHVISTSNSYGPCDQNFDQPLDLTNNVHREEYTKGKIFKTKMLKKSYPKGDTLSNTRDKTNGQSGVNSFPH